MWRVFILLVRWRYQICIPKLEPVLLLPPLYGEIRRRLRRLFLQKPTPSSAAEKRNGENCVETFEKKRSLSLITEKPSAASRRLRRLFLPESTPTTAAAAATSNAIGRNADQISNFKKKSKLFELRWPSPEHKASIRRLTRAGKFSRIDEIVQHQKRYPEIKQEHFTAHLIKIYGEAKMLDYALKLFDEMPELGCPCTVVSFNALLAACFPSQNLDILMKIFRELPSKISIEPDVMSYTSAMKALCLKGSFDDAVSLVEEMTASGVDPDATSFYVLLYHLHRSGRFVEGEKVWNLMKEKNVDSDRRCYNARLHGLISEKLFSQVLESVKEMQQKGLNPNSYTYNTLIEAFMDEENAEEVKKWYEGLELKEEERGLSETGIDWAVVLCEIAADKKIKLPHKIVKRASDDLIKNSKVEEAKKLLHLFNLPVSR